MSGKGELPGWLKHATVWLVLAAGLFLGVQAWLAREQSMRFVAQGSTIEIRRAADGHYHWPARIGGQPVEFLVDTGATTTAIPAALATQLKLPEVGRVRSQTAGGVVDARVVLGDLVLEGGVQAERLRMAALPALSAPLLGMDVLGRLRWRQEAGVLHIEMPRPAP